MLKWIALWVACWSEAGFVLMGVDKRKANKHRWRGRAHTFLIHKPLSFRHLRLETTPCYQCIKHFLSFLFFG